MDFKNQYVKLKIIRKMKKMNLQHVIMCFVSLWLFISCIGEGPNTMTDYAVGVVREKDFTTNVLDVNNGFSYYSSLFANKMPGDCFWIYYELDYDDPQNSYETATANGYYKINVLSMAEVERFGISYEVTDTTTALYNEVALLEAVMEGECAYVKGMLFIWNALYIPSDQELNWDLSCDMENVVPGEYLGQRAYDVFLRSTLSSSSTNSPENVAMINAFYMKNFLERVAQEERKSEHTSFKLRFNYVSDIKDGQLTWATQYSNDILVETILSAE